MDKMILQQWKQWWVHTIYKLLNKMGAEIVYNPADYRLVSSRVLKEFANLKEVNLFLRGMFPLVGFKCASVYYERHDRLEGKSHYPLSKMLALAFNSITSLSVKPIRMIAGLGRGSIELYWNCLGNCISNNRKVNCRMVKDYMFSMFYGRNTINMHWSTRGVYWQNIYGSKG